MSALVQHPGGFVIAFLCFLGVIFLGLLWASLGKFIGFNGLDDEPLAAPDPACDRGHDQRWKVGHASSGYRNGTLTR